MDRGDFSKPFFMSGPAGNDFDKSKGRGRGGRGGPSTRGGGGIWMTERNRYSEAYGNYQGGYGPGGGFGPRPFGPPPPMRPMMGPRPLMGPPGPGPFGPPRFRPGPGPMRPHDPVRFLERCGVKFESIRSLPKDILRLFLPNFCGVCEMEFDTFRFARLHYMSKAHFKNQREWLLTSPQNIENRIKPRDIYCELCDVQITSKQHADSHYAGKLHRAVVEGKKLPKNTKLLEPEYAHKLDLLKRREKRAMKVEGSETAGEEKSAADKMSEFYCDICNTAMTCSEQLRAHMNGKRHLAKEKQRILSFMKNPNGEEIGTENGKKDISENAAEAAESNDNANGDQEVEAMADVEAKADEEVKADDADESWVHGTGEGWDTEEQ